MEISSQSLGDVEAHNPYPGKAKRGELRKRSSPM